MKLRLGSLKKRAQLIVSHTNNSATVIDLERASNGKFSPDPMDAYAQWDQIRDFASTITDAGENVAIASLDSPVPQPRQLFAVGLNYRQHAIEFGLDIPPSPLVFTKFPSSVGAPCVEIPLTNTNTDWEVEMVLVVGSGGRDISQKDAWNHIAGICVGQDISNRIEQFTTNPPQFSLGKSFKNHTVYGPWVVDAHSLSNRDGLHISCTVNGREVQSSNTSDLIFSVSEIVEYLSNIVELYPGDIIYTGTPSGIGNSRQPPEFLTKGDVIVSTLESAGTIVNTCT
jgi:2-keto-4-pentenoate hydratase/2-oxohepta-3-ene-1,7-dioic acid hydratase in catechol pathway